MDVEALHVALQQSFSADSSLRGPAEKTLRNLKFVPGSTAMLLQVAAEKQVQFEVRQAAAIQLKNTCRDCWEARISGVTGNPLPPLDPGEEGRPPRNDPILEEEEKMRIRANVVEVLLAEHEKSLRALFAETLHSISNRDFPDKWPTLLPMLIATISQSADPSQALRVHNALLALRKICKRYEYKSRAERGPLNEVVNQSFDMLLPLAQRLSDPNEHSLEAAMMLKQIIKIFWSATQFYLPGGGKQIDGEIPRLAEPGVLQPWFDVLSAVLLKPLPEAGTGLEPANQPTSVEERNAWPWWKAKKWSIKVMSRLFSRYGLPSYAEEEVKEFARNFSQTVAPQFLKPVCETLNLRPSGQFCTDIVVNLCLTYINLAVELSATYKLLKPHLDFILYKVCFPTICLTPTDLEQFENDPHEFIHRQASPMAEYYEPRFSALGVLVDLVKHRGKDVTQPLLTFLTECLQRYATAPDDAKNHVEKDGALLAFGSLSNVLKAKKKYNAELEGLLVTFVYPEFNSPIPFLRYRACWMVQAYFDIKWSEGGTNLNTLIQFILQRLQDPSLPVQIEASKSLRDLIQLDGADAVILPHLAAILGEYFRIMNEIGNDDVISALEVIIDKFGDQIEPHAVALVTQLANAFVNYCGDGEDDDDAAMAASQCLECISTVLKGIYNRPEMYRTLEPILMPLVLKILGNEGEFIEYLENALDILTFLTYFTDEISLAIWEAFPLLYNAYDNWAFDYIDHMVPSLQNFIAKAPHQFLQGKTTTTDGPATFIQLIFAMVAKTVTYERVHEQDVRKALSLYLSVLDNCRGMVDAFVPLVNDIILAKLGQQLNSKHPYTRIAIFKVLGSAFYYNPQLQLAELEKRQVSAQVLQQWIVDSEKMDRWLPMKLTVMGMTSLLQIPMASMPAQVSNMVPQLIATVVRIAQKMKDELEEEEDDDAATAAKTEAAIRAAGGAVDEEDFDGFGEDEDVTNPADQHYLEAWNRFRGSADDFASFVIGGHYQEDMPEDDEDYSSPLDEVDQLLFLNDTLKAAYQREPEVYQQIQVALPSETVTMCQSLFAAADAQRAADSAAHSQ